MINRPGEYDGIINKIEYDEKYKQWLITYKLEGDQTMCEWLPVTESGGLIFAHKEYHEHNIEALLGLSINIGVRLQVSYRRFTKVVSKQRT